MSEAAQGKMQIISGYLHGEFPEHSLNCHLDPASGNALFTLERDGLTYDLRVTEQSLQDQSAEEIVEELRRADLPGELCRSEGLGLVLTPHGLRVNSSN